MDIHITPDMKGHGSHPALRGLLQERQRLIQRRDEIDGQIASLDAAIRALVDPHVNAGSGQMRMARQAAVRMRQEAGQVIWQRMHAERGREFGRRELEALLHPDLKYHFPRVLKEWNESHPDKPILNNGRDRNKCFYFVK